MLKLEKFSAFKLSPVCRPVFDSDRMISRCHRHTKILSIPVKKDTEGAIVSVLINGVPVLSGLNLEKM